MIDDKALEQVSGGQDAEIVFGTKDLSPETSQDIQSYTEPNDMEITPYVENTQQTIQKYEEPTTPNFSREAPPKRFVILRPLPQSLQ